MTKRVRSECRPVDARPEPLKGVDAPDNRSRHAEGSRRFAQDLPHMAGASGQRPWIPWFLSQRNTGLQGSKNAVSTHDDDGAPATDSSSAECESARNSHLANSANQNPAMYNDDAYIFDAPYIAMATAASSPIEQTGSPASSTPSSRDIDHSCDLEALALRLLWQNQIQELRYRRATQIQDQEQARLPAHNFAQPAGRREPRPSDIVDGERLDRIMSDLDKLGTRLREDARKQLDVINDDNAALPLCL
ncbi:hypothetical protein V8C44DRAFT_314657 [Trichoderma aethiopicum]